MSLCVLAIVSLLASGSVDRPEDRFLVGAGRFIVREDQFGFVDFTFADLWVGVMAADKTYLYAADALGQLQVFEANSGVQLGLFQLDHPVQALAAAGGSVFAGFADGEVLRLDPTSGQSLGSRLIPAGVRALLSHDGFLFAAGGDLGIYRAPISTGEFEYFSCFCSSDILALGVVEGDLIASDESGTVKRMDFATGAILNVFSVGPVGAMTVRDDKLLFYYGSTEIDGTFEFVDAQTGSFLPGSFESPFGPLDRVAMLMVTKQPKHRVQTTPH